MIHVYGFDAVALDALAPQYVQSPEDFLADLEQQGVATAVVDKTFEDPKPALQLVAAVQAVSEHYGPALRAEFDVLSAKLEERGADPAMLQRVEALFKTVEDLTTDVNDH